MNLTEDTIYAAISVIQKSLGDNATTEMVFNVVLNVTMTIITRGGTLTHKQTIESRDFFVNAINQYVEGMTRPVSKKKDNVVRVAF